MYLDVEDISGAVNFFDKTEKSDSILSTMRDYVILKGISMSMHNNIKTLFNLMSRQTNRQANQQVFKDEVKREFGSSNFQHSKYRNVARFFQLVTLGTSVPIYKPPKREKERVTSPTHEFYVDDVTHAKNVKATMFGGNLVVLNSHDETATCRVQWQEDCAPQEIPKLELEGDTIRLSAQAIKPFVGQRKAYVIELHVPARLNIDIKMTAGTIYLENVEGELFAKIATGGTIHGYARSSESVNASVFAGDIRLHGLRSQYVRAHVQMGDIQILFDDVPNGSNIKLVTGLGDVKARFPEGFLAGNKRVIKKSGDIDNTCNSRVLIRNSLLGGVKIDDYHTPVCSRIVEACDDTQNNENNSLNSVKYPGRNA